MERFENIEARHLDRAEAHMTRAKQRTAEYRMTNIEFRKMGSLREIFFNQTEYIYSTFEAHQFLLRLLNLLGSKLFPRLHWE